jgi:TetR/AcrR family transcriptional regulator, transcriptional repressor for nem operon
MPRSAASNKQSEKSAGAQTRANGELTRQRLIEACLDHVWDRGYAASSVALIAESAGAPKGSVFYHFPTKDEIIIAAVDEYVARATARRKKDLLPSSPVDRSTITRLKRYFRRRIEARRATKFRRGCLLGNLAAELDEKTSPKLAKAVQNGLLAFESDLTHFLRAAAREGEIRQDLPIAEVAAGLVNGWEGALLRMKLSGSSKSLESFVETIPTMLQR